MKDAEKEGEQAFADGEHLMGNPYNSFDAKQADSFYSWRKGYSDAKNKVRPDPEWYAQQI